MSQRARRTQLMVTINGIDATSHITPSLKDFSFKDNAKGKADDVNLSLTDIDGRWQREWFVEKGSKVTAQLVCHDWYTDGEDLALPMGMFVVDEVELSGPPDTITVKAVSAAKTSAMSEEARSKGWETYTLRGIADEIARRHGYSLLYDAPEITFGRVDQREIADLPFLNNLARRYGINLKVHDGQMILYGAKEWDAKAVRYTIARQGSPFSPVSWSFRKASQGTSQKAEVNYHQPAERETVKAETAAPGQAPSGQTLTLNQRVENASQAIALSNGALRESNEGELTASMDWMGFPGLVAGITLRLEGWGHYDGSYFVESAEHKLGRAYTTSAELRKTLPY